MATTFTFMRAHAAWNNKNIALAGVPDNYVEFSTASHFFRFINENTPEKQWTQDLIDIGIWIVAITDYHRPKTLRWRFCVLSAEGEVVFLDEPQVIEKIPGTGIASPDSQYWGRMQSIRGIGDALFACGDGGQIYQRLASGEWKNLAPELLQKPPTPANEYNMFWGLNGPSEKDVYITGRFGKIFHWDGSRVRPVASPVQEALVSIAIENESKIWISGARGTLIVGNHRDGFRRALDIDYRTHLNQIALYQGRLYVTGVSALYTYESGILRKVITGLTPEIDEVNYVDTGAGILWAGGGKDIIRFDGTKWERIDFPLNTPIR